MKCPFRTKKIIEHKYDTNQRSASYKQKISTTVNTELEECIEDYCFYYRGHNGWINCKKVNKEIE